MMSLVVHLLMCRYSCSTFSTKSAIRICVVLNEPGSVEMLALYGRVAAEEPESEVSDLDTETESEVSEDEEFSATPPTSLSSNKKLEWTKSEKPARARREQIAGHVPLRLATKPRFPARRPPHAPRDQLRAA